MLQTLLYHIGINIRLPFLVRLYIFWYPVGFCVLCCPKSNCIGHFHHVHGLRIIVGMDVSSNCQITDGGPDLSCSDFFDGHKYIRHDAADIHTELSGPDELPGIPNHGRTIPLACITSLRLLPAIPFGVVISRFTVELTDGSPRHRYCRAATHHPLRQIITPCT